nr:hypothetical protein [uncultured bacterium]
MNPFTTGHPLTRDPSPALMRLQKWIPRGFLTFLVSYPVYLLFLGPYSAVIGTSRFDFLPQIVRDIPFYPAAPVYCVPGLRSTYDNYLHRWYRDPNEADPETGWY